MSTSTAIQTNADRAFNPENMWDGRYASFKADTVANGKTYETLAGQAFLAYVVAITLMNLGPERLYFQINGSVATANSGTLLPGQSILIPGNKVHLDALVLLYGAAPLAENNVHVTEHVATFVPGPND